MGTVIAAAARFRARRCPARSLADHPTYGACVVLSQDGDYRLIEYLDDDSQHPECVSVHVDTLTERNPLRDLGLAY